ncbi:MAG: hypothetical protein J6D03_00855 [Clostridia bacterium]|nr:hypothetical protein [Clostridia bacterium]
MDIKNSLDFRTYRYTQYDNIGKARKYDYARNGILRLCVPKTLFTRGNTVLITFLQLIDMRTIMLFKYIDKVKQFKYFTWK